MKKLVVLISLILILALHYNVNAQIPFFMDGFENQDASNSVWTTLPEGTSNWTIYTSNPPQNPNDNISYGNGHCSFAAAGVNGNGSNDDWMITPRIPVYAGYIFSFYAQAWDPTITESLHLVASKSSDSTDVAEYTINISEITVNSSENINLMTYFDLNDYQYHYLNGNGSRGYWKLYQFQLDQIPGLNVGDKIFIGFHYDNPAGNSLVIDEVQYDKYCPSETTYGSVQEAAYTDYYPSLWWSIPTIGFNEVYGPNTNGLTNDITQDVYSDAYVYLANRSFGLGDASLFIGQMHNTGLLGIQETQDVDYGFIGSSRNFTIANWIDFNGDGVFDNSERVNTQTYTANNTYSVSNLYYYTVPANAKPGYARARFRIMDGSIASPLPCQNYKFGQTWDFDTHIFPSIGQPPVFNAGTKPILTTNPTQYITNVTVKEINHDSEMFEWTSTSTGTTVYGYNYTNYTWIAPATLHADSTYTMKLTANQNGAAFGVWLDYNQNSSFADAGEEIYKKSTNGKTVTFTFTVPHDIIDSQQVVLRVKVVPSTNLSSLTPTYNLPAGKNETEDYRVMLLTDTQTTPPVCSNILSPSNSATGVDLNPTITWNVVAEATGYDVYFGTTNPPVTKVSSNQKTTSYTPTGPLTQNTIYYWQIVPKNSGGDASGCTIWSFTTLTLCDAPTLIAKANNVASEYVICPRGGFADVDLTANSSGGVACTSSWVYSWFDGKKYWNKVNSAFDSNIPLWDAAINNITITVSDSIVYTVAVKCSDNATCQKTSSIEIIILKNPPQLNLTIGTPANGVNHAINISWDKQTAVGYRLEASINNVDWSQVYEGKAINYDDSKGDYPNGACYYRIHSYNGINECKDYLTAPKPAYTACDLPNLSVSNATMNSVSLFLNDESPVANPAYTEYSLYLKNKQKYINKTGGLSDTAVFLKKSDWGLVKVVNLDANTNYCFTASARNKDLTNIQTGSEVCLTTLNCSPVISSPPHEILKCKADSVNLRIAATGEGTLKFQWYKDDNIITDATDNILTIYNLNKSINEGAYTCSASNYCTSVTSNIISLYINNPPTLSLSPAVVKKALGDKWEYSITPEGIKPFSYQWKKGLNNLVGETNSILKFNSITLDDEDLYYCIIKNDCGNITKLIFQLIVGDVNSNILYGNITYDNPNSSPLAYSEISVTNIDNGKTDKTLADSTGNYLFRTISKGNYVVSAKTDVVWDGSDPLDALLINRYYIGSYSFGDKLMQGAADVSADNNIDPLDALLLNRRYIGAISAFDSGDWLIPEDSLTINQDTQYNFKGICFGDVNASNPIGAKKSIADIKFVNSNTTIVNSNQLIEIPINVTRDLEIGAIGLKLAIDNRQLAIVDVKSEIEGMIFNVTPNEISLAWSGNGNPLVLRANQALFTIKLLINHQDVNLSNSEIFTILPKSVIGDARGNRISGENLSIPKLISGGQNSEEFSLSNNYPNPFSSFTNINYTIGYQSDVKLSLYNILGEKITDLVNSKQQPGTYTIKLDRNNLSDGLYFYTLDAKSNNKNYIKTNNLIITH